jgi:hypothetical protein
MGIGDFSQITVFPGQRSHDLKPHNPTSGNYLAAPYAGDPLVRCDGHFGETGLCTAP